jgi:hypothetical protein
MKTTSQIPPQPNTLGYNENELTERDPPGAASMRLSWNEIRARAAQFAEEWKDAHYERGESQTFYNEFFELFGVTRRHVLVSRNL